MHRKQITNCARNGGTCTFIFRKKHKSDTRCTSLLIPIAHYSVVLRTVSSHIRLRG